MMKKRLNTRLLAILASSAVACALAVVATRYALNHYHRDFQAAGDRAVAAGRWDEAAADYSRAVRLGHGTADLFNRLAGVDEHRAAQDPQAIAAAEQAYESALGVEPRNAAAARGLFELLVAEVEIQPSQSLFTRLAAAARRVIENNPSDHRALVWQQAVVVLQSESGAGVAADVMKASTKSLADLSRADPSDADAARFQARGLLQLGIHAAQDHDSQSAKSFAQAATDLFDAALKARPDNAVLQWRAQNIYLIAAALDSATAPARRAAASDAIARAAKLIQPTDAHYDEIQSDAASSLVAQNHGEDAQKLLRAALGRLPSSGLLQLRLAELLAADPSRRAEALTLLQKPIGSPNAVGVSALQDRALDQRRQFQLAHQRLDAYASSSDEAEKAKLLTQLDAGYDALSHQIAGEPVLLLRLRAAIEQLKGRQVEAMSTLRRALTQMEHSSVKDYELLYQAAMLNRQEGQNDVAEQLLGQIIAGLPRQLNARLAMAELLLEENAAQQAAAHLDVAQQIAPDSPQVLRLRVQQLTAENKTDEARAAFNRFPENDPASMYAKARLAAQIGDAPNAERLLLAVLNASPDDPVPASLLAQVYIRTGRKQQAESLLEEQLKKHPKDLRLLLLQKEADANSPQDVQKIDDQIIAATDEFSRQMLTARLETRRRNFDAAKAALDAADRLRPRDPRVQASVFELSMARHDWPAAEKQIATIADLNADGANGKLYRVRLALARGDREGALQTARELVSARPEFAESFALLGQALLDAGKPSEAVDQFSTALDKQHNNIEALQGLIEARLQLNQPDRAAEAIRRARSLFPASETFRDLAIDFDLRHGDHPQTAVAARAQLLNESPDAPAAYVAFADAALFLAEQKLRSDPDASAKLVDQAIPALEKAVSRWPDMAQAVADLAQVRLYRGDPAAGEKLLKDLAARPAWVSSPEPSRLLGELYAKQAKHELAAGAFREAYEKSGHAVNIQNRLATVLVQAGKPADALKVLDDNAADPGVARARAELLIQLNRADEAEKALNAALRSNPDSLDLKNALAALYLGERRVAEGRTAARAALAIQPNDDTALYNTASIELVAADGDLDLALRSASQLKDHHPADPRAVSLLADVYVRRNQPDDALGVLLDGAKLAPADRALRLRALDLCVNGKPPRWSQFDAIVADAQANPAFANDPTFYEQEARGLVARHRPADALARLDEAIRLMPGNPSLSSSRLTVLLGSSQYQEVLKSTDTLLAGKAPEWWMYLDRGIALAQTDKITALQTLDQALAAAPDFLASGRVIEAIATNISFNEAITRAQSRSADPNWQLLAVDLRLRSNDTAGAIAAGEHIRQSEAALSPPQKVAAYRGLSLAYEMAGRWQEARDCYEKLLALEPNNALALNNLANILAENLHRPADALPYSQRAYDITRNSPSLSASVADTHGWTLTLCGGANSQIGLDILRKLVEDHQDFIEARYHLGEALLRSGMTAEAARQLAAAQDRIGQLEQNHEPVKAELKAAVRESLSRAAAASSKNAAAQ